MEKSHIIFQAKPQLAADMLKHIYDEKIFPFRCVLGDSVYGMSLEFIATIENMVGGNQGTDRI